MSISIENVIISATFNKVRYKHGFTTTITITDPRINFLTVSPQDVGKGITGRNGTSSPIASSFVVRDVDPKLFSLYMSYHKNQGRIDFMIADTATGERYDLNDSIITTSPVNVTISEGETSFDVSIVIETPPSSFKYTPANA